MIVHFKLGCLPSANILIACHSSAGYQASNGNVLCFAQLQRAFDSDHELLNCSSLTSYGNLLLPILRHVWFGLRRSLKRSIQSAEGESSERKGVLERREQIPSFGRGLVFIASHVAELLDGSATT